MKLGEPVFVDTGGWIALALERDPFHARSVEAWAAMESASARPVTSVPVVMETFTFLERNTRRDVALAWQRSLRDLRRLKILECRARDLEVAWKWFDRRDLPKLSAVDASSFVLMQQSGIRRALAFDVHFATAGFLFPS